MASGATTVAELTTAPDLTRTPSAPKRTASQRKRESLALAAAAATTDSAATLAGEMSEADATLPVGDAAVTEVVVADPIAAPAVGSPARRSSRAKSATSPSAEIKKSPRGGKRKQAEVVAEEQDGAPVSQSQDAPPEAEEAASEEPPKKKGRARSLSRKAAAAVDDATMEDGEAAAEPIKKKGRSKSAVSAAEAADGDEATPEPIQKKGRSKSAGAGSAKKKAAAGGSQEEDGEEGEGTEPSAIAAAVLAIEQAKRAARPAGSTTLMCWNVNGLRAALRNGAAAYLNQVDADVIALCEVKADNDTVKKEFDLVGEDSVKSGIAAAFAGKAPSAPKYHKHWNCCTTKKGYSGTAIFSKVKPLSVVNGIGHAKHDDEGRTITAEFESYYLVCTYVPNSGQKLERLSYRTKEWDADLLAYLQVLEAKKPVVWTGDLNVAHHDFDIHSPKTNKKSAGFTQAERDNFTATVTTHGFVDVFHKLYPEPSPHRFTYWGHRHDGRGTNKGWRLDYWVTSPAFFTSHVLDTWIGSELSGGDKGQRRSDHAPIFLSIK